MADEPRTDETTHALPEVSASASSQTQLRNRRRFLLFGLLAVIVAVGTPYGWRLWQYYQIHESTDDAYVVGDIIPVNARISGTVSAVYVREHQNVEAGQLLANLDPRDFELRVQQAASAVAVAAARLKGAKLEVPLAQESTRSDTARTNATLRGARSSLQETRHRAEETRAILRTREAAVAEAKAEVDRGQARLDLARIGHNRAQQLFADGIVAQQQFDEADGALRTAQAAWRVGQQKLAQARSEVERANVDLRMQLQAVERARAQVAEAQALLAGSQANRRSVDIKQVQVQVAEALRQQAQADLDYAQQQLAYTALRAPLAGVIAKKNLEVGQVVQAGRPLLAIVPLQYVWVEANFKETQLHHMRPGQKARLEIDTFSGRVFTGSVESISPGTGAIFSLLPPENATGNFVKIVQRVPVKIVFDTTSRSDVVLRPGMSVSVTVTTR
ncbi:MAG: HlyD family secretion protein [bacterium]|nr:HlyD family secretion protein [bacterium]